MIKMHMGEWIKQWKYARYQLFMVVGVLMAMAILRILEDDRVKYAFSKRKKK